jgi:flagellar P-ring protein FlgI
MRVTVKPSQRIIGLLVLVLLAGAGQASPSRLKDIALFNGLGNHKLLGYGLVAGLEGTGDGDNSLLTARTVANMLEVFGVTVAQADFKAKNVAAVIVTAEMPAVVAVGNTLDVTVSSLADAKSLQGGTLLLTPLRAADGEVYAVAQGAVTIGGFSVKTSTGDAVQKNHVTVGRVPNGASVVKPLQAGPGDGSRLTLSLLQPDFTTALRVAEAINQATGPDTAQAIDNATIQVKVPAAVRENPLPFMVLVEGLAVEPDAAARVVINERTGTVVIGQRVRIMPVAICHGGLTVEVKARTEVSQPPPLVAANGAADVAVTARAGVAGKPGTPVASSSPRAVPSAVPPVRAVIPGATGGSLTGGQTVAVRQEDLQVTEGSGQLAVIPEQATLNDLVRALNALGVKPRDLIAILQALKEAHALRADLVMF